MPKLIDEEKLFAATLEIFTLRGYEGATTKEIATVAGINESTIFRRYGSKANLIAQAIQHQLGLEPFHNLVFTGDLHADLIMVVETYIAAQEIYGWTVLTVLLEAPRYPELAEVVGGILENQQDIAKLIIEYQQQGILWQEPPYITINALIAPLMVRQMFENTSRLSSRPPFNIKAYVEAFLRGRQI